MARKPQVVNLSQETLDQITPALHSMRDSLKNQTRLLTDTFNLQTNELRAAERRRNLAQSQADGQAAALAAAAATPASPAAAGGTGGGGIGGLGIAGLAGLGGLAMGAMKGVGGLALLGVAIPTFFGGLLAGSETLGWMQETKGMDFEGLKTASLGFSEVIKVISPEAMTALAALTGIAIVGGAKAATGLGAMGFGISAFLGGLLAGDAVFAGFSALGGSLDYESIKLAVAGAGSIFDGLDTKGLIALGTILGGTAVASAFGGGTAAAKGVAYMGLGISGFLAGLLFGDTLFAGASALGASLNFESIKTMLAGFSNSISQLSVGAVAALGTLFATGGLIGYSPLKAKSLAKGMFAVSLGILGLMAGFAATDVVGSGALALGASADFSNVAKLMAGFSSSVENLTPKSVAALTAMLTTGGILGALTKAGTKAKMVAGAAALGASIVAFMGTFAGGAGLASALGVDGSAVKTLMGNFGGAIDALSEKSLKTLGTLVGVGGTLGAITGTGIGATVGAAVFLGIPALGASIAGFFLAFDSLASLASVLGVNGANTKILLTNFAEGIGALANLQIDPKLGTGLIALSGGLAAFFAADAFGSVTSLFSSAMDTVKSGWNWLFGKDSEDGGNGPIAQMIAALEPLKTLDDALISKMDKFGLAMNNFVSSFQGLSKVDASAGSASLGKIITDVGAVLAMMDTLMKGGIYDTGTGPATRIFGSKRGLIDFGPGLDSLDEPTLARLTNGVDGLRNALGRSQVTDQQATTDRANSDRASSANIAVNSAPVVINKGGSTRSTI